MNALPPVASSPRRAALLVHAMPRHDREWLLGSLAPQHRVELELLLDELQALGIPPDETLLRQVIDAPSAKPGVAERLEGLAPGQVAVLVRLLQQEPPQVAASLLAVRAWPWREQVLQAVPAAAATAARKPAPALQQAICESVLRQIESLPPLPPAAAPARIWTRLRLPRQKEQAA